jgi:hypothetical protein
MITHGITSSTADFWLHFHPINKDEEGNWEPAIYWYHRTTCLEYINTACLELIDGKSKDANKTITGAGYLVPKNMSFIRYIAVPKSCVKGGVKRWTNLTDRESGIEGEKLVRTLAERFIIDLPQQKSFSASQLRQDQFGGRDFKMVASQETVYEIKTERVISSNLFVQHEEGGHQVHFTPSGTERVTEIAPLLAAV